MSKKKPKIIIIEGLKGVGKTSLVEQLQEILEEDYRVEDFDIPSYHYKPNYEMIKEARRNYHNPDMGALLVLTLILHEMDCTCTKWTTTSDYIILDGSFYETFATQIGSLNSPKLQDQMVDLVKTMVTYEHIVVYLEETRTVRLNRLLKARRILEKDKESDQYSLKTHKLVDKRYKEFIAKLNPDRHIFIKGNRRPTLAIAKEVLSRIEELGE